MFGNFTANHFASAAFSKLANLLHVETSVSLGNAGPLLIGIFRFITTKCAIPTWRPRQF
jgi:hypothetical protein